MKKKIKLILLWMKRKFTGRCMYCGGEYHDRGWHRYCPSCDFNFMENSPIISLMSDETITKDEPVFKVVGNMKKVGTEVSNEN